MILEIVGALALAALVLWLVFTPMAARTSSEELAAEPENVEETRRGIALLALKEIEFDRETGKLSEEDYLRLKSRYGAEALAAMAAEAETPEPPDAEALIAERVRQLQAAPPQAPGGAALAAARDGNGTAACVRCGPRPEPDAAYCSSCGAPLGARNFCSECGGRVPEGSRFCADCGNRVAA